MGMKSLLAAPHRAMFMAGTIQALLAMGLWTAELGARPGLWASPSWSLPPPWWHAFLMGHGVLPFFIFGFILTAGPRWQGAPETPPCVYLPSFLLLAGGWLLAYAGLALPPLFPAGLALVLAGWLVATGWLWRIAAWPARDRLHIRLAALAASLGAAGLLALLAFVLGAPPELARGGITLGLWGFLLPLFFTVIHRMLPFFSGSVIPAFAARRDDRLLLLLWAASLGHGLFSWIGLPAWTWPFDLPAAVVSLHLTLRWRIRESFAARLLAVLHVGFAWAGISLALFGVHSQALLSGWPGLGLAPLHALTLGFFASTLIGMASRVTLGHSGRPLEGDGVMWFAFWSMQAATLLRVLAEWLPFGGSLSLAAALVWLAAFGVWAWRYAPYLWQSRVDGMPG